MKRFLIFIGMTVGGWIGWLMGQRFGIMTAFVLSTLGSLGGVIVAWRINRQYLG